MIMPPKPLWREIQAKSRRFVSRHASVFVRKRLAGFDGAALIEVVEHVNPSRLEAFAAAIFGAARPKIVALTTPNVEYTARFAALHGHRLRHPDHRFEWTRAEFEGWARAVADRFGYQIRFEGIGDADPALGAPMQMGVFTWS